MNIIEHNRVEKDLASTIFAFAKVIHPGQLAQMINFRRKTAIPLWSFVSWLIQTKFMGRSLYRAEKAPDFSTHTLRNVLNDGRINWQRLICKVAASVGTIHRSSSPSSVHR